MHVTRYYLTPNRQPARENLAPLAAADLERLAAAARTVAETAASCAVRESLNRTAAIIDRVLRDEHAPNAQDRTYHQPQGRPTP